MPCGRDYAGVPLVRLRVYFKEYFDWNKPKGEGLKWTSADAERPGRLTVAYAGTPDDFTKGAYVL